MKRLQLVHSTSNFTPLPGILMHNERDNYFIWTEAHDLQQNEDKILFSSKVVLPIITSEEDVDVGDTVFHNGKICTLRKKGIGNYMMVTNEYCKSNAVTSDTTPLKVVVQPQNFPLEALKEICEGHLDEANKILHL